MNNNNDFNKTYSIINGLYDVFSSA